MHANAFEPQHIQVATKTIMTTMTKMTAMMETIKWIMTVTTTGRQLDGDHGDAGENDG